MHNEAKEKNPIKCDSVFHIVRCWRMFVEIRIA